MKAALDDRIDEVVRGDGGIDENLPIAWANQLDDARKLKRAQVEKFRTGPQAEAFRTGADNMPKVQGGEFAGKVWGQRAGIADDIKQFRKVMDDFKLSLEAVVERGAREREVCPESPVASGMVTEP